MLSEKQLNLIDRYLALDIKVTDEPEIVFQIMLQQYIDIRTAQYIPEDIVKSRFNQGIMFFSKLLNNSSHASACLLMKHLHSNPDTKPENINVTDKPKAFLKLLIECLAENNLVQQDDFIALLVAYFYMYEKHYQLSGCKGLEYFVAKINDCKKQRHEQQEARIDSQYLQPVLEKLDSSSKDDLRTLYVDVDTLNSFVSLLQKGKNSEKVKIIHLKLLSRLDYFIQKSTAKDMENNGKFNEHTLNDYCNCIASICMTLDNLVPLLSEKERENLFDVIADHIQYLLKHKFYRDSATTYCLNALCLLLSKYDSELYRIEHAEKTVSLFFKQYIYFSKQLSGFFSFNERPLLLSTLIFLVPKERYSTYTDWLIDVLRNKDTHKKIQADAFLAISRLIPFLPMEQQQGKMITILNLGENLYEPEYNKAIINLAPFIPKEQQLNVINNLYLNNNKVYTIEAYQRFIPFCDNDTFETILERYDLKAIKKNMSNSLILIKLLPLVKQEDKEKIISTMKLLADEENIYILDKGMIIQCLKKLKPLEPLKPYISTLEYDEYFKKFIREFIAAVQNRHGSLGDPDEVNAALWALAQEDANLQTFIIEEFLNNIKPHSCEAIYTLDGLKKLLPTLKIVGNEKLETYLLEFLSSRQPFESHVLSMNSLLDFISEEKLSIIYVLLESNLTKSKDVRIVTILNAMQAIEITLDKHKQLQNILQTHDLSDDNITNHIRSFTL